MGILDKMFETVAAAPPDPILGLTEAFHQDERPEKINLTLGVYRDENGATPVLECVKRAEQQLLESETTKGYLGIDGLAEFKQNAMQLTLGDLVPSERVAVFQTPGGTGALRVAADSITKNFPGARIWYSSPTWPNHLAIFESARIEGKSYPYLSADKRKLDFAAMMDSIEQHGRAGDVICLHACCHNPSGVDPTTKQWSDIAELTAGRGMLPLVDFAYHGFGSGLEEDRNGIVELAKKHEELLICSSYSKNFGLYSERVGAIFAVCASSDVAKKVGSSIKQSIRTNYSNPPRHGGSIVATVLANSQLKSLWITELAAMRQRILSMRQEFVEAMKRSGCETDFSFLLDQRGMFSFSGLTPLQVDWLRSEKGIFIVGSGRINVAGITPENMQALTTGIAEAVRV